MPNTSELLRRAVSVELVRRNMTQSDLAAATEKNDTWISNRMTGRVALDIDDLDLLARGLGLTAFELIESARAESASVTTEKTSQVA